MYVCRCRSTHKAQSLYLYFNKPVYESIIRIQNSIAPAAPSANYSISIIIIRRSTVSDETIWAINEHRQRCFVSDVWIDLLGSNTSWFWPWPWIGCRVFVHSNVCGLLCSHTHIFFLYHSKNLWNKLHNDDLCFDLDWGSIYTNYNKYELEREVDICVCHSWCYWGRNIHNNGQSL